MRKIIFLNFILVLASFGFSGCYANTTSSKPDIKTDSSTNDATGPKNTSSTNSTTPSNSTNMNKNMLNGNANSGNKASN